MELVVRQLFSGQENEHFIAHLFLKESGVKAKRRTVPDAGLVRCRADQAYTDLLFGRP